MNKPRAIAMGDPTGIGPEITAKAWAARTLHSLAPFFAVGDPCAIEKVWAGPIARISDPAEAADAFDDALPILSVGDVGDVVPGTPDAESARCALQSLEMAA